MLKKFFERKKGFTLIELIIVVAIIGIIAGIAIPRFLGVRTKAKVTRAFADMANIGTALEMYYVDKDEYPVLADGETDLGTAIDGDLDLGDYISSIPDDPFGDPDEVLNYRYYCNGVVDATTATLWLIVSNGPDGELDVDTTDAFDWDTNPVAGQIGGPDGVLDAYGITTEEGAEDGGDLGDGAWSVAGSSRDLGDIGRAGP